MLNKRNSSKEEQGQERAWGQGLGQSSAWHTMEIDKNDKYPLKGEKKTMRDLGGEVWEFGHIGHDHSTVGRVAREHCLLKGKGSLIGIGGRARAYEAHDSEHSSKGLESESNREECK